MEYIMMLIVVLSFYGSGLARRANKQRRIDLMPIEPKGGSLSEAIVELVAFAGGIYLTLNLVIEFLAITGLERVSLWGVAFDPIAAVSIVLALLQPLYERLRYENSWC
ncbi:hypothetical protein [Desulfitibacter alkalitolerans]|uniref:hypothetical protein n=1 Tax=Desulfitibacter alkalitolerans TaxID=264641 RepID=UPI000688F5A5|nr:hypothetical protein [Desulfitibacter alkalitolerans]